VKDMAQGKTSSFACALDWHAAVANGVTQEEFFLEEKARLPESVFQMEYESKFVGATTS
jgi:hypothetical protein